MSLLNNGFPNRSLVFIARIRIDVRYIEGLLSILSLLYSISCALFVDTTIYLQHALREQTYYVILLKLCLSYLRIICDMININSMYVYLVRSAYCEHLLL